MPHPVSRAAGFLWLLYVGALALLSFAYNSATWIYSWPWWGVLRITIAVPIVVTVLLAVVCVRKGEGCATGRMGWWFLMCAGLVQLISAVLSEHVRESLGFAIAIVSAGFVAPALAVSLRTGLLSARSILTGIGLLGLVFSIVSLVMWLWNDAAPMIGEVSRLNTTLGTETFKLHPHGFRNASPFGHWNFGAGAALLFLPWLAGLAFANKGRRRILWIAAFLLAFVVLLSTGSRGAVIGLAAGSGFALLLAASALRWSRKRIFSFGAVAVVLLALVIAAVPRIRNSVIDQFSGQEMTIGDEQRVAMIQIGARMGVEKWMLGQGPGLVPRLYPRYRDQVEGGTDIALQLLRTPLHIWAETGAAGLLSLTTLFGAAAFSGFHVIRKIPKTTNAIWAVGSSGVSLVAYLGFALTDHQFDVPMIAAMIFANVGVLFGIRPPGKGDRIERSVSEGKVVAAIGGIAFLLLIVLSVPEWRARSIFAKGVERLEAGIGGSDEWNAAVIAATELQPDNPHYLAGGAAGHLRLGFASPDPQQRAQHLAYARAFLEQVVEIEPDSEFARFNLGWLLLDSNPVKSAEHFKYSAKLLPDRGGCYFGLGLALLESGDQPGAIDAFALELINDPAFIAAPAWDTPLLGEYVDEAVVRAVEICHQYESEGGRPYVARVRHVQLLMKWLVGDDTVASSLAFAGSEAMRGMFDTSLSDSIKTWNEELTYETPGWFVLAAALQSPVESRHLLNRFIFIKTKRTATEAELSALEAMIDRYGTDWRAWVRSEESRMAPFVKSYRRDRRSYPIIFRNMDIPVADDAYLIQESTLIEIFFRDLFPRRGYVPDTLLLDAVGK